MGDFQDYSYNFNVSYEQYKVLKKAMKLIDKRIELNKKIIERLRNSDNETWKNVNEEKVRQILCEVMGLIDSNIILGKMITGENDAD
jgi:hypothetical protein